ncbi:hypothetical protein E2P64_06820 [Candidatus Bathyarchaeota archaeon]|nr:hypothetical protein E2P64_06820 [Candidatus Bathyarchaeota archaeon]
MKHFEDVWVEAERISSELYNEEDDANNSAYVIEENARQLQYQVEEAPNVEIMTELVGELLFRLTRVCKEFNINSWTALEKATNDAKIDLYDED